MTQQTDQITVNTPATSGAETAAPAESEFDKLIKEFDNSPANKATANLLKSLQPVIQVATDELASKETARINSDLNAAVAVLKDDEAAKAVPDRLAKGFLRDYSVDHPEVALAWENRAKDPSAWKSKLAEARKAFVEEIKALPANTVRTEVEAAAAAVRNVSTAETQADSKTPADMMNMSDREWRKYAGIPAY